MEEQVVGMAGEFVAAVLQTAGLHGQSQVLINFRPMLQALGAFIYIWFGVGAVIAIGMWGNYKHAAYMLIGPALFWFMLTSTTTVTSARHQFGDRPGNDSGEVQEHAADMAGVEDAAEFNTAEVSTFYVIYDKMVSSLVQNLVTFLVDTGNREDLLNSARERVYSRIMNTSISEKQFMKLLSASLMGECSRQLSISKELSSNRLQDATGGASEQARQLKVAELARVRENQIVLKPETRAYVAEVLEELGAMADPAPPPDMAGLQLVDEVTCGHVWQYTRAALLIAAKEKFRPTAREEETNPDVEWNAVYDAVKEKLVDPDTPPGEIDITAIEILAAYYLRKSLETSPHAVLTESISTKEHWDDHMKLKTMSNVASHHAMGTRMRIVWFAGSLPYLQGVILYLLSILFPFFCFFLLAPGRQSGFFTWMGLWLWVKSWDVGFAFVSFLRDVIWNLMPNTGVVRTAGSFTEVDWNDPSSVMNVVYLQDPTANMNMYYMVIATVTLAVPVVTAQMCLGAANIWGSVKAGFEGQAQKFEGEESNASGRREAALVHNEVETKKMETQVQAARLAGRYPGDANTSHYNMNRAEAGDATVGRYQNSVAALAGIKYHFGNEMMESANFRAGLTGRVMDWHHGKQNGAIAGLANINAEQYSTSPAYKGSVNAYTGGSGQYSPTDTGLQTPQGGELMGTKEGGESG